MASRPNTRRDAAGRPAHGIAFVYPACRRAAGRAVASLLGEGIGLILAPGRGPNGKLEPVAPGRGLTVGRHSTTGRRADVTVEEAEPGEILGCRGAEPGGSTGTVPGTFMSRDDFVPSADSAGSEADTAPITQPVEVRFNSQEGLLFALPTAHLAKLPLAAMYWRAVVRNRDRWSRSRSASQELNLASRKQLADFGVDDAMLAEVVRADVVEVSTDYSAEEVGWQARVFPWEYVLNAAAKLVRDDKTLTVVRHLAKAKAPPLADPHPAGSAGPGTAANPPRLLFVQSAPGRLGEWGFDLERDRVVNGLGVGSDPGSKSVAVVKDPDRGKLGSEIGLQAGRDPRGGVRQLAGRRPAEPARFPGAGKDWRRPLPRGRQARRTGRDHRGHAHQRGGSRAPAPDGRVQHLQLRGADRRADRGPGRHRRRSASRT